MIEVEADEWRYLIDRQTVLQAFSWGKRLKQGRTVLRRENAHDENM